MKIKEVDVAIIGAGSAGLSAAYQAATAGPLLFTAQSCPTLVTLWTVAHQAPLSLGFSRQ